MGFLIGFIVGMIELSKINYTFENESLIVVFVVCLLFVSLYGLIGLLIELVWKLIKYLIKGEN